MGVNKSTLAFKSFLCLSKMRSIFDVDDDDDDDDDDDADDEVEITRI